MPAGKGKYTTYVPPKSPRRTFFENLFKGDSTTSPPFYGVDQADAYKYAAKEGNDILRAAATSGIQAGDAQHFPDGVDFTYGGAKASIQAPDTSKGADDAWVNAGDPANSYVPDLSSPGPGKTDGVDKSANPKIKSSDVKPTYVPGGPNTGTRSPTATSGKVHDANTLGDAGTITSMPDPKSGLEQFK
jgi:hypothetical protein